jgi:hypothetical protein
MFINQLTNIQINTSGHTHNALAADFAHTVRFLRFLSFS